MYVPAQYKPDQPACVYVNQDGIQWKAPTVFDNLIHRKEMPVTIGVFVMHGRIRAANADAALDRFNRSFEYDGLGDAYARFILDEILPDVEKQKTSDGRAIRLSKNGNDRAIGGSSSGAVCAFTAAWECPANSPASSVPSVPTSASAGATGIRPLSGNTNPSRCGCFCRTEPTTTTSTRATGGKPTRSMERALTFAGYEVRHVWGEGAHNGKQGTAIFPDAMRWLWKDWPKPVTTGKSKNQFLSDILIPGEDWKLVGQGYQFTEGTAANAAGEVFYQDIPNSKTYKIAADGKPAALPIDAKRSSGTAFGPDGSRYVVAGGTRQILRYDKTGKETVVAQDITGNDLVVARNGAIYITSPDGREKPSTLYLLRPNGEKVKVDEGLKFANGIALTPIKPSCTSPNQPPTGCGPTRSSPTVRSPANNGTAGCTWRIPMRMPGRTD